MRNADLVVSRDYYKEIVHTALNTMAEMAKAFERAETHYRKRLKVSHLKDICEVCWTSSWAPCEKDYPDARKVLKGKDEYVMCQMCKAEKTVRQLTEKLQTQSDIVKLILSKRKIQKPGHGTCCTCQKCGYEYDDCKCENNKIFEDLAKEIKT